MDASARLWLAQPTAREARSEAVFAFTLQPSDTPAADMIASAISRAVQRLGTRGCAETMAQEFGDHPWRPSGCAGRASSPPSPPRSDRLHGTRTGRPADQAPESCPTRRPQHPTAQPEEQ